MPTDPSPPPTPRFTTWLLARVLAPEDDAVLGDLVEEYADDAARAGRWRAAWHFRLQALNVIPSFILHNTVRDSMMFTNYLKVTLRNLFKNKAFSAINILGLAVSMSICLLIILFVRDQRSYDQFQEHKDRIYRVTTDYRQTDEVLNAPGYATSPATLAGVLKTEDPEVEETVRLRRGFGGTAKTGDTGIRISGHFAEQSFFSVFSFELAFGDPRTALVAPNSIVLFPETADKLFGNADPVGKVLQMEDGRTLTVTGVIRPGYRTHLDTDALVSFSTLTSDPEEREKMASWQNTVRRAYTYVLFREGADPGRLTTRFPQIIDQAFPATDNGEITAFHLQPLTGINLGPLLANEVGVFLPSFVGYLLAALAAVIILMAGFNYTSLSVARSLQRAREISIRKVVGARRGQLVKQFLSESVTTAVVALLIASVLLFWLVPLFNSLWLIRDTGHQLHVDVTGDLGLYVVLAGFALLVGLLAGAYPAFYLSSFDPVKHKGGFVQTRRPFGLTWRRGLIVAQFTFSLFFIVTALVLYRQTQRLLHTEYGFDTENVVNVSLKGMPFERFRDAVASYSGITGISGVSQLPASGSFADKTVKTDRMEKPLPVYDYAVDDHFIGNLGLSMVAGDAFSDDAGTANDHAVVINEMAVGAFGWDRPADAVGQLVTVDDTLQMRIAGVVHDFKFGLFFEPVSPMIMRYDPDGIYYANVRTTPETRTRTLAYLRARWHELDPVNEADVDVYQTQLTEGPVNALFNDILNLIGMAAGFAVLIACLGLLGMAMHSTEVRRKEIGVRKVLGAGEAGLILLLSKHFLALVGVAVVLALPLAWFVNNLWLQYFADRVPFDAGVMVPAVLMLLVVALLTIGSQTLKAARANPACVLQVE